LAPFDKDTLMRYIFHSIKYLSVVNFKAMNLKELKVMYEIDNSILKNVCKLTPADLMSILPVKKTCDGEKNEMKDCFTTMEALQAHGLNKQIQTKKKVDYLLRNYMNDIIIDYQVNFKSIMLELRRLDQAK